jgi:hypothetical protein
MDSILGRVIAAILVLLAIAGVVYLGSQAMGSSKVTNATSDLAQIQTNVEGLYANNPSGYSTLTNTVAISAGAIPADMVSGTSVVDQWGNTVTVQPSTAFSGLAANSSFEVDFSKLSSADCVKIATGVPGAYGVVIGVTQLTATNGVVDAGKAATACSASANTVDVVYAGA